jgi:hypothetical protein
LIPASAVRRGARGPAGVPGGGGDGSGVVEFDLSCFASGKPGSLEILIQYLVATAVTFPSGLVGSLGQSILAATGSPVFSIQQNAVEVGTATFDVDSIADFVFAADVTFNPGDVFTLVAPSVVDSTLSGLSFTFKGSKV